MRTALTVDMWEALNDSWNHLRNLSPDATEGEQLPNFLGWVQERVTLFNGAAHDTMLRNEPWRFVHLGTMLERADNTARLLDVKHELFAPGEEGAVDYVQWQAVLRSVSALRVLPMGLPRKAQPAADRRADDPAAGTAAQPGRPAMPRWRIRWRRSPSARAAGWANAIARPGMLKAQLRYGRIDDIFEEGLHEFLTGMITRTAELGAEIDAFYIKP